MTSGRAGALSAKGWTAVALVVGALLAGVMFFLKAPDESASSTTADSVPGEPNRNEPVASAQPEAGPSSTPTTPEIPGLLEQEWDRLIEQAETAVAAGPDRTRQFVYSLFAELDRLSPADRLAVVLAFFESGRDVDLGGRMSIGRGGRLEDWPTLRTALLDYLSQRDGAAARDLAQVLLQSRPTEPGEWTLALRELARGRSTEQWTALVRERVHDFINDAEWNREARISWLEGFDVVVAGGAPAEYLPDLSAIAGSDSRAAAFAAFLAADRLMLAEPADTLATLNRNPRLFAAEPNVRAGLFARADVRKPDQRQQLETYLRRADVSAEERAAFSDLFPHYDLAVSFNLLTPPSSRPMADMIAHDRATLERVETWLGDQELANWHAGMRDVQQRLREQLAEADQAR